MKNKTAYWCHQGISVFYALQCMVFLFSRQGPQLLGFPDYFR